MLFDQVVEGKQRPSVLQQAGEVCCHYQIGVVAAGNHQAHFCFQIAHQGFSDQLNSCFFFDDVSDNG